MTQPAFRNVWDTTTALPGVKPEVSKRSPARRRPRGRRVRLTLAMAEGMVLCAIVALLLVLAGTAVGDYVMRPTQPPVVEVTVERGDTLWSLAATYGAPNDYILRRVDRLAALNHLEPGARLQPGQVLQVPVENPAMLSK